MNWFINFSELTYNTTLLLWRRFTSLPITWGLKEVVPGFSATVFPALLATLLQSPSIKLSKIYAWFNCGSICIFLRPGITNGFLTGLFTTKGKSISLFEYDLN